MSYDKKFNDIVAREKVPKPQDPIANYIPFRIVGKLLFLSGTGPFLGDKIPYKGKLGKEVSLKDGQAAARLAGINLLFSLQDALGTLDKVANIVQIEGMVNCTPDFTDQSTVIDGCSNLLVEIFGNTHGKHTRSAAGFVSLVLDIPVEIKMIVEIAQ